MGRHRDLRPVRKDEVGAMAEFLDVAEDVVPPPAVQPDDIVLQLPEDLVQFESGQDRLDQHGHLDGAAREAEAVLREVEDTAPQSRLEMTLELGQVEIGPGAPTLQLRGVVEQVQPEIDERARDRLAIEQPVLLVQVPAARAHQQDGGRVVERVLLALGARELDRASDRVVQVDLPLDDVRPAGTERILAVSHEDLRARIERVDHHLPVGRAGDLDPSVEQVAGYRRNRPVRLADGSRLRQEVRQCSGIDLGLAPLAACQQLDNVGAELPREAVDELQRRPRQDRGPRGFDRSD